MHTKSASKFRWVIVFLLFFITVFDYIDRAAISYAISDLNKLFTLTPIQSGWILGVFGLGYVITTFFGGIWADRIGPRITMTIAVICWSLSLIGCGFAMGFVGIMIARLTLGLAEGPNFPCMTRGIANWLPGKERVRALSLSLVSVPVALAIGGPIVSHIIANLGWRWMFIVLGIVGLIWVPFWWIFFRDKPKESRHVSQAELRHIHEDVPAVQSRPREPIPFKAILFNKTLIANCWAFLVFGYYLFFFMTWLPSYLEDKFHLALTTVGWFTFLPWALAAILMLLVGYIVDKMNKKNYSNRVTRSYMIIITQLLSALCVLPLLVSQSLLVSLLCISGAVGFLMGGNPVYYVVNIDVTKRWSGTALGIMEIGFAVAGFLAPMLTGWIVHATGHFYNAFALMVLLSLSSIILMLCCHHPDRASNI